MTGGKRRENDGMGTGGGASPPISDAEAARLERPSTVMVGGFV